MNDLERIAKLEEEVIWRTKAMASYQAYIDKIAVEYELLFNIVGAKAVVELELQVLRKQDDFER